MNDAIDRLQEESHQVGQTTLRKERPKRETNFDIEPRYYKES